MDLFAKAAGEAKVEAGTSKAKEAPRLIPDDIKVRQAIDKLIAAKKACKEAESKVKVAKGESEPWAREYFLKRLAETGVQPETFWVKGITEEAQFIAQDRSGVNDFSDQKFKMLKSVLGDKRAESMVVELTEFSLNSTILSKPGVPAALSQAIMSIPNEVMSPEDKGKLLIGTARRLLKEGTVANLPRICDGDAEILKLVVDAIGSNLTTYLQ